MMKVGFAICLSAAIFSSASFAGQDIVFFEGNNCTQDRLFSYDSRRGYSDFCQLTRAANGGKCHGNNDEARSVQIAANAQHPVTIRVYDNPDGRSNDDWTYIVVNWGDTVCIGSFERNINKDNPGARVHVKYHKKNGLDGKVSSIRISGRIPIVP